MIGDARLYGILDLGYVRAEGAPAMAEKLIAGGVQVLQLRAKKQSLDEIRELTSELLEITSASGVPLIVNDHAEIAAELPVAGVHLGQDDLSVAGARAMAKRPIIVGKSTHAIAQAVAAENEGADYIGFGPLFATPTKPDYEPIGISDIRAVHALVKIPIFCIGGIKLENLPQVVAAGAKRVVIVSGLLRADDPADYARAARRQLI